MKKNRAFYLSFFQNLSLYWLGYLKPGKQCLYFRTSLSYELETGHNYPLFYQRKNS